MTYLLLGLAALQVCTIFMVLHLQNELYRSKELLIAVAKVEATVRESMDDILLSRIKDLTKRGAK